MLLAERIKECRTATGLSQAELATKLCVSRQAVTKWESGRGYPDIDNLKNMAALFGVSVDHLLAESTAPLSDAVLREPVDVTSLTPYKPAGTVVGAKSHAAVRQIFPNATIWPLARTRRNSRVQEAIEWVLSMVWDAPFGIFGTADAFGNRDAHYLVQDGVRQLLARVSAEAVISRELSTQVTGRTFRIDQDHFRRFRKPL